MAGDTSSSSSSSSSSLVVHFPPLLRKAMSRSMAGRAFLGALTSSTEDTSSAGTSARDGPGLLFVSAVSVVLASLLIAAAWYIFRLRRQVRELSSGQMYGMSSEGRHMVPELNTELARLSRKNLAKVSRLHGNNKNMPTVQQDSDDGSGQSADESESFYTAYGEEIRRAIAPRGMTMVGRSSFPPVGTFGRAPTEEGGELRRLAVADAEAARRKRPRRKRQNANLVTSYKWFERLLRDIVEGGAELNESVDKETQKDCVPLFVVAGVSPSSFPPSPMQAVLFVQKDQDIDFWYIKPAAGNPTQLQKETLSKHSSGPHKNNAEKSKNLFAPLAEKFRGRTEGNFTFGVDADGRAFIEEWTGDGQRRHMYVYFVWLESWSATFASKKFLEGKICYGTSPRTNTFFARQFRIEGGSISLEPWTEQEPLHDLMPGVEFQEMMT